MNQNENDHLFSLLSSRRLRLDRKKAELLEVSKRLVEAYYRGPRGALISEMSEMNRLIKYIEKGES